jgi:hypothetical protein
MGLNNLVGHMLLSLGSKVPHARGDSIVLLEALEVFHSLSSFVFVQHMFETFEKRYTGLLEASNIGDAFWQDEVRRSRVPNFDIPTDVDKRP